MDGFKTSPKMQCFKEGGAVKYKSRHSEKSEMSEDIAQDKKVVKKAFAMHDKQSHEGEKTNLSKLKKGGRMKKEGGCVGRYKEGGSIKMKKDAADIKDIQKIKLTKTKKAAAPSKAAIKPAMSNIAEPAPDMGAMPPMMKKGGNVKKYNMGGMASYDQAMQDPKAKKMMRDASIARTLKANPISETELSSISDSGPAKGLRNYGRMYKQGLGMKPDTAYEYKKGGKAKKYADGRMVGQGAMSETDRLRVGQGAMSETDRLRLANRAKNRAMLSPMQQKELDAQEAAAAAATQKGGMSGGLGSMIGRMKKGGKAKAC